MKRQAELQLIKNLVRMQTRLANLYLIQLLFFMIITKFHPQCFYYDKNVINLHYDFIIVQIVLKANHYHLFGSLQYIYLRFSSIKQIYISSMQFISKASQILTPYLNQSFALRRNVRIRSSKLPPDFFATPSSQRYVPSPIIFRQIGTDLSNRQPRTPSFQCRKREIKLTDETIDHERKVQTARPSLEKINNEDELISVVLSSTNKLRRVVRKQSLDMKQNCRNSLEDRQLRLPQIVNKAAQRY